jgi:hypothetical protein
MGNRGFVLLHNSEGAMFILVSGLLLVAMIVGGALLARINEHKGRELRARLKCLQEGEGRPRTE